MSKRRPSKRGMRRAHLKRWSAEYVNTGRSPNRSAMATMRNSMVPVGKPDHPANQVPKTLMMELHVNNVETKIPRAIVLQQMMARAAQAEMDGDIDGEEYLSIKLRHSKIWQARLFFRGTTFFIIEYKGGVFRSSLIYHDRADIVWRYQNGRIGWVDELVPG